jgi:hypothetical protein
MADLRSVCLVLGGMVLGLGYAVACGGKESPSATGTSNAPSVPNAMAQTPSCQSWEVSDFSFVQGTRPIALLPTGYTPLTVTNSPTDRVWAYRCVD